MPSAHRDEIAEHSVGRSEHRNHGAPHLIFFDQTRAKELGRAFRAIGNRDDHDVGVKCAYGLDAREVELEHVVREALDRAQCRFSCHAQIYRGARLSRSRSTYLDPFDPFELDFGGTAPSRRSMKLEITEAQPLALLLQLLWCTRVRGHQRVVRHRNGSGRCTSALDSAGIFITNYGAESNVLAPS